MLGHDALQPFPLDHRNRLVVPRHREVVRQLSLAYDYAMAGDDEPVPMIEREGLQSIMAEHDPNEQMRMYAEFVTGMGERISALWLALRGAAEVDDEAREALHPMGPAAALRAGAWARCTTCSPSPAIRPEVTPDEAAAIFWVLTDPALFHQLVVTAGWSRDRFQDWLHEAFKTQILAPAATGAGGPPARRRCVFGRRRRRLDVHMPGIERHSSVSMVPPIDLCGWFSSKQRGQGVVPLGLQDRVAADRVAGVAARIDHRGRTAQVDDGITGLARPGHPGLHPRLRLLRRTRGHLLVNDIPDR